MKNTETFEAPIIIKYPESMPQHLIDGMEKMRQSLVEEHGQTAPEADKYILYLIDEYKKPPEYHKQQEASTSLIFKISDFIKNAQSGIEVEQNLSSARKNIEELSKLNIELKDKGLDLYLRFYNDEIKEIKMQNKSQ